MLIILSVIAIFALAVIGALFIVAVIMAVMRDLENGGHSDRE